MNSQFNHLVTQATKEVQEEGLNARPQSVMLFCFGRLDSRFIRFDWRLIGAVALSLTGIIVGVISLTGAL